MDDIDFFRSTGHGLIDFLSGYLEDAEARRLNVLPDLPPLDQAAKMRGPVPREGVSDLMPLFIQMVSGSNHLHHPGYVGHQVCPPLLSTALGELVSGLLNQSMAVYEMGPMATQVERQTVRWLCEQVGWGGESDGVFTSGGSLGNLTALLVARNIRTPAWEEGVTAPVAIAVSEQAHYSVERAARILGLGNAGCLRIPVDSQFRMRPDALRERIDSSPAPVIAVVGSACTTATGSFDPLTEIAEVCRERGLWFHVDGAHGVSFLFSKRHRHLLQGIELADSVVWDAHKMLWVPGLATAVLFKRGSDNFRAFATEASYLFGRDEEEAAFDVGLRTIECTKRMLAWKLWLALHAVGTRGLEERLDNVVARAHEFAHMVKASGDFELLTDPSCNIVCFRAVGADDLQPRMRRAVIADGRYYLVQTRAADRTWLRCTFMNPRTTSDDLRGLLDSLRSAGSL